MDVYIKKITLGLVMNFFLFSLFSEGMEAEIQLIDRVIAVVDSSVIMESELNNRVEEIIGRLRSDGTELPPKKILEEQILERLISVGYVTREKNRFIQFLCHLKRIFTPWIPIHWICRMLQ